MAGRYRCGIEAIWVAGEPDFAPPVLYDALFEQHMEPTEEYLEAIYDLLSTWSHPSTSIAQAPAASPGPRSLVGEVGDFFHEAVSFVTSIPDEIHWRAGIVAEWIVKPFEIE